MKTLFYGADVRERIDAADPAWADQRREQYLLRPEIAKPLSIDPWVWRRPSWAGRRLDEGPLPWVGLDEVRRRCLSLNGNTDEWSLVAIGVVAADQEDQAHLANVHGIDTELMIGSGWQFLGYDIADGETSGLCNTGYGPQTAAFRDAWAARLNDHGLFPDVADALAFRAVTDERVPEHACFTVYGLWLVG